MEGSPLTRWQLMPFERAGKLQEEVQDLAFQGLTLVPPDRAYQLLGRCSNISKASRLLFPLLSSRAPPYDEALNWLKFAYAGDRMGDYVAPASTELVFSTFAKG